MAKKRFKNKKPETCEHIWAVVVTYNVGQAFAHHIKTYLRQVNKVILVDNSTETLSRAIVRTIAESLPDRIILIANTENVGLAKAQNQGIEKALSEGAEWVLLLDDDSHAVKGMFTALKATLADYTHPEKVGILAPVIFDENTNKPQPFMVRFGPLLFWRRRMSSDGHMLDDVLSVISAGSMVRKEVFEEVGLMREDFFIDYVDTEFCLRTRAAKWLILAAGGAHLNHSIGAKTAHRLLGKSFHTSNHSAERRFTIYRNRSCMWKGYWRKSPGYVLYDMMAVPFDIFRILAFEKHKRAKMKAVFKGLSKGLFRLPRTPKEGFPTFKPAATAAS